MSTLAVKNVWFPQAPVWSPGHEPHATPVTVNGTGPVGVAVAVGVVPSRVGAAVGVEVDVRSVVVGVVFPVLLVVGVLFCVLVLVSGGPQPARNSVRMRHSTDTSKRTDNPEDRVR